MPVQIKKRACQIGQCPIGCSFEAHALDRSETARQGSRSANFADLRQREPASGDDQGIRIASADNVVQVADVPGSAENTERALEIRTAEQDKGLIIVRGEKPQTFNVVVQSVEVSQTDIAPPNESPAAEVLFREERKPREYLRNGTFHFYRLLTSKYVRRKRLIVRSDLSHCQFHGLEDNTI
jgi:hypothetical protein